MTLDIQQERLRLLTDLRGTQHKFGDGPALWYFVSGLLVGVRGQVVDVLLDRLVVQKSDTGRLLKLGLSLLLSLAVARDSRVDGAVVKHVVLRLGNLRAGFAQGALLVLLELLVQICNLLLGQVEVLGRCLFWNHPLVPEREQVAHARPLLHKWNKLRDRVWRVAAPLQDSLPLI